MTRAIYYGQTISREEMSEGSIFLAGPTPRETRTQSWRPEAIKTLEAFNFEGVVFVPEHLAKDVPRDATEKGISKEDLWEWEQQALEAANVIAFWVPREMNAMPGLTTNIEFGMWMMSGKIVFGAPPSACDVGYMRYVCENQKIAKADTLHGVLHLAVMMNMLRLRGEVRTDRRACTSLSPLDQLKKAAASGGRP